MFGLGWGELVVVGIMALIVVGPKDLPVMFKNLGRLTGKARGMAREFTRAMEAAADDAGVKDISSDLKNMTSAKNMGLDQVKEAVKSWDHVVPGSETAKLAQDRAEAARKIHSATAKKEQMRREAEKVAKAADEAAFEAETPKQASKKVAVKTAPKVATAKKAPAKKAVSKKPAVKKAEKA